MITEITGMGNKSSSREYDKYAFNEAAEENTSKNAMYNSPRHNVSRDTEDSTMVRQFDRSNNRTTLIDNEVRVYKGGSWRDRVYWIDPAQRRYLPQYIATDYIGFRNAMSRVGSKSKNKNKTPKG